MILFIALSLLPAARFQRAAAAPRRNEGPGRCFILRALLYARRRLLLLFGDD